MGIEYLGLDIEYPGSVRVFGWVDIEYLGLDIEYLGMDIQYPGLGNPQLTARVY